MEEDPSRTQDAMLQASDKEPVVRRYTREDVGDL